MFPLAHLCHIRSFEIDQLKVRDLYNYVHAIDAYIESMKKTG